MQAKLPDVNAAIVTHRNQMLHAFNEGRYNTVITSWSAINSLLPEGYKVKIDDHLFQKLIQENKIIICPNKDCTSNAEGGKRIKFDDADFHQVLLNPVRNLILQKKYESIWICPSCKTENIFSPKQIRIQKYEEPYYLEVIPSPPKRHFGISDRPMYDTQFRNWYITALNELESKIGKYRADYIAQLEANDTSNVLDVEHEKEDIA